MLRAASSEAGSGAQASRTLRRIVLQFPTVKKAFKAVRKVWKQYDADGNGTLDLEELRRCLDAMGAFVTPEDAEAMFKEVDFDNSKGLDFREFVVALALGCVLQLFPSVSLFKGSGAASPTAAASAPATPPKDAVAERVTANPLASASAAAASSSKPPQPPSDDGSLARRGRSKSYVRTKQMTSVVEAMKTCLEIFMIFDIDGDGLLQREEVMTTLVDRSRNARRHSGVGFGASSFLSVEQWEKMPWDRRGNLSFREYCLAFYDWICPEGDADLVDEEEDEEEDGSGKTGAYDPLLSVGKPPHAGVLTPPAVTEEDDDDDDDDSLGADDVSGLTVVEKAQPSPPAAPARSGAVPTPPPLPPPP